MNIFILKSVKINYKRLLLKKMSIHPKDKTPDPKGSETAMFLEKKQYNDSKTLGGTVTAMLSDKRPYNDSKTLGGTETAMLSDINNTPQQYTVKPKYDESLNIGKSNKLIAKLITPFSTETK